MRMMKSKSNFNPFLQYTSYLSFNGQVYLSNLLIPYGFNDSRKLFKIVFDIYNARILERNYKSFFTMFKNSIIQTLSPSNDLSTTNNANPDEENQSDLNPFVRITFADISVILS
jgi:hypothetical protein